MIAKKDSFAQQLRKAAQTVGIDIPSTPALWCSTRFRQQGCGLCCKDSTPPGCLSRRYSYKNHP
ncbi:hypothetical protein FAEPRAM212_03553 [Faecalibacterium prausnitzii M21/2]|uniref:Uncharacterized protein n=1 Tax=Faecalibacterium prausnitzii M21/2 TaxID=411485 RepID=A8SEI8_9FIRM|nr:hypothetical protein FAEPRAM212_03553 [Faecalibacterium prausnitzii M21/2]